MRRSRFATLLALVFVAAGCGPVDQDDPNPTNPTNPDAGGTSEGIEEVRSSEQRISNPQVSSSKVKELTGDNGAFALDLYSELAKVEEGKNFFYSPHSISSALAMTYAGMEGSSEAQTKQALHFDLPESELHPAFNKLDLELEKRATQASSNKKGSPFKLEVANSIWGQQNYPFKQPFLDTLAKNYGAGLRAVNFAEKPDAARTAINDWVEQKTEDRIKDLLPKSAVGRSTRMVLTNAIYFKASWANKFDEGQTQKAPFTTGGGQQVQVDMMSARQRSGFAYAEGSNWKAVEMPYVGDKVSMVVLVPDSGAFGQVEQSLSSSMLQNVFSQLSGQAVDLEFPKFDFESKFSVKKMLQALGMNDPFTPGTADLSDIADSDLFIDDVIHQSFVAVDEKGTEAAAATAVTVGETSVPEFTELTVDRPFLFMIRDRETNAVVFLGRVLDPS
jgi:serpin B